MNASWHCRFHPRINRTADTASAREDPTSFRLGIIDYSSRLDMILLCRHEGSSQTQHEGSSMIMARAQVRASTAETASIVRSMKCHSGDGNLTILSTHLQLQPLHGVKTGQFSFDVLQIAAAAPSDPA